MFSHSQVIVKSSQCAYVRRKNQPKNRTCKFLFIFVSPPLSFFIAKPKASMLVSLALGDEGEKKPMGRIGESQFYLVINYSHAAVAKDNFLQHSMFCVAFWGSLLNKLTTSIAQPSKHTNHSALYQVQSENGLASVCELVCRHKRVFYFLRQSRMIKIIAKKLKLFHGSVLQTII